MHYLKPYPTLAVGILIGVFVVPIVRGKLGR